MMNECTDRFCANFIKEENLFASSLLSFPSNFFGKSGLLQKEKKITFSTEPKWQRETY